MVTMTADMRPAAHLFRLVAFVFPQAGRGDKAVEAEFRIRGLTMPAEGQQK